MDALNEFVASVSDSLWPWRSPSLKTMALQPDSRERNPLMMQFYTWESHGNEYTSWWKHFEQEVPNLRERGVTHVWLPPMAKSQTRKNCGYDVYDLWDLGEFDQKGTVATRWGTKEELIQACSAAKSHGLGVIVDVILNHRCGGDQKEAFQAIPIDERNRLVQRGPPREIEAWTIYNFPGRQDKYSSMKWNHRHFSGVDWDSKTRTKGVLYIPGSGRNGWSKYVANELGNYDFLLGCDIDHRQPEVKQDLFNWGTWIVEQTGAVGFRVDAMKHYDRKFLREFLQRTKKSIEKPDFFVVSEFWSGDINILDHYVGLLRGSTSFFDVPLHYNFHNASKQGPNYDLRQILKNTLVGRRPWDAVTFVDNHDTEIGQSLESWVNPGFKLQAYALILLRAEGFPCVFYGDLYPNNECYDPRIGPKLEFLIQARTNFAYGSTTDYFHYKDCIGWVRNGDARSGYLGCAVVIRSSIGSGEAMSEPPFSVPGEVPTTAIHPTTTKPKGKEKLSVVNGNKNKNGNGKDVQGIRMKAPASHHKKKRPESESESKSEIPIRFRDLLGGDLSIVTVDKGGWALFPCPDGGVTVWVPETLT